MTASAGTRSTRPPAATAVVISPVAVLLWSTAVYTQACQKGLAPAADRVAQDAAEVRAERTRDPGLDHVYAPNQECDRTCQVHQGQGCVDPACSVPNGVCVSRLCAISASNGTPRFARPLPIAPD